MERQITAIRAQKNNRDRLNIELDGEYAFGLSRMVAAWLKVGDTLNEERIASLKKQDGSEAAYQKATRLLDYRARTAKEVRQKLQQKGFDPEDIERVLERLQKANLVQDEQYAKMWVENRNASHPRSRRLIRYELRNKGISEGLIDSALVNCAVDEDLAKEAASRYARKLDFQNRETFRKRLSAYLVRRGFSYGTVQSTTQSLIRSLEKGQSSIFGNEDDENGTY